MLSTMKHVLLGWQSTGFMEIVKWADNQRAVMEGFSLTRLLPPHWLVLCWTNCIPLTGPFGYFEWGLCGNGSRAVWSQWYVLAHTTWAHQDQSHQPLLWQGVVTVCCSNDWHVSRPGIFHMGNFCFLTFVVSFSSQICLTWAVPTPLISL